MHWHPLQINDRLVIFGSSNKLLTTTRSSAGSEHTPMIPLDDASESPPGCQKKWNVVIYCYNVHIFHNTHFTIYSFFCGIYIYMYFTIYHFICEIFGLLSWGNIAARVMLFDRLTSNSDVISTELYEAIFFLLTAMGSLTCACWYHIEPQFFLSSEW